MNHQTHGDSPERPSDAAPSRAELCKLEIGVVQDNIARFDTNGIHIKTWCVTTWTALQAFTIKDGPPRLALAGVVVSITYALAELLYRRFQYRFIERARQIEALLATGDLVSYRYGVTAAATSASPRAELHYCLTHAHFYGAYVLLSALSVVTWACL